jgi:hypothetical protein
VSAVSFNTNNLGLLGDFYIFYGIIFKSLKRLFNVYYNGLEDRYINFISIRLNIMVKFPYSLSGAIFIDKKLKEVKITLRKGLLEQWAR